MVSNLAFLPFQQPSPVDNFLSAYSKGQDMAAQRANQERQKVVNQREDQTFAQDQRMKTIDQLGAVLDGVQDGDEAGFQRAKDWAVQNGLLDPNEAQRYTVAQLPQIRALSQQARQLAAQRAASTMAQQKFDLDRRATEANIRQSDAAAAASNRANRGGGMGGVRAPSGYQYVIGEDGKPVLQVIPGGPADPATKPLTDEQAKAAGFAARLRDADTRLWSPGVQEALMSGYNNTVSEAPLGIGNALVTNEYQIGDQARRDFLNAQLRRESGAVIGESEFSSGTAQYFPVYGDKEDVRLNKAAARKQAIYNMYVSAGPRYADQAAKAKTDYEKTMAAIQKKRTSGQPAAATIDAADAIVGIKR